MIEEVYLDHVLRIRASVLRQGHGPILRNHQRLIKGIAWLIVGNVPFRVRHAKAPSSNGFLQQFLTGAITVQGNMPLIELLIAKLSHKNEIGIRQYFFEIAVFQITHWRPGPCGFVFGVVKPFPITLGKILRVIHVPRLVTVAVPINFVNFEVISIRTANPAGNDQLRPPVMVSVIQAICNRIIFFRLISPDGPIPPMVHKILNLPRQGRAVELPYVNGFQWRG